LAEGLERYLADVNPTKKGAKAEADRIRQWQRHPLASRSLASIRSHDIAEWRNELVAAGKAPTTVRNAVTIISQVYKTAASEWGMSGLQNPVAGVRMPKLRPGRERRLHPGEEERLLAGCRALGCAWMPSLVVMALETGMRLGELLSLRRENIVGRVARLTDTKNGRPRDVPLSSRALGALKELPVSTDGRVFPMNRSIVEWRWKKVCQLTIIEDLRFHDLRHEATSRLFERGLDVMEVASITGHRTLAMLARYTHLKAAKLAAKLG
jgi:integrase